MQTKARGSGGPWKDHSVKAGEPSDPYLMTAYDRKSLKVSADQTAKITVRIDLTGDGAWVTYREFKVDAGNPAEHEFPLGFSAYWIRFIADRDVRATAWLEYR
jgi:hypothetical protein